MAATWRKKDFKQGGTVSNFLSRWLVQRRLAHVPKITVDVTRNYYMTFTAPNPDVKVVIRNEAGTPVGRACYAVSPLNDRVYIYEVEILGAHRRQGYGTALLLFLARTYDLPITVVKELYSACSFWRFARGLGSAGIRLTQQLSVSDMASEAERWAHLQPKARELEEVITHRLSVERLPWSEATTRGLGV
ncbi:GNAT family N-acetyltransferase [Acidovorax sp. SUPP1855]|uniref:GNAT family N-acetyltransferase n=1 Tax=Acidovorax sp. SUPP1855 TaxID=431774 RepID=UPI0023DE3B04|nr:GNAT family N-acetyltransferase [Acidovorax sp. SUPP1855]GKS87434.1 GNAT family N-acetyltransferase [Acidovorax sp. SUPP1855]